jgi:hypothetical protein
MTAFLVVLGIFCALFFLYLFAGLLGFDDGNPNDPRSEADKRR